jgi:hypothetical protein
MTTLCQETNKHFKYLILNLKTITATNEDLSEIYSDIACEFFANINCTENCYEYAIAILAVDDDTISIIYTICLPN